MHSRTRRLRLNHSQISQALEALEDIPSDSDISGLSDDSDLDESFVPRGEEVVSSSDEDNEEAGEENGAIEEAPETLQEASDPLPGVPALPLDPQSPGPVGDAPPAKRRRPGGRRSVQREWVEADLPTQEFPENRPKPIGMDDCRHDFAFFMKLFGQNNISLITEQSNIFRYKLR